jgi:hypothetical protein
MSKQSAKTFYDSIGKLILIRETPQPSIAGADNTQKQRDEVAKNMKDLDHKLDTAANKFSADAKLKRSEAEANLTLAPKLIAEAQALDKKSQQCISAQQPLKTCETSMKTLKQNEFATPLTVFKGGSFGTVHIGSLLGVGDSASGTKLDLMKALPEMSTVMDNALLSPNLRVSLWSAAADLTSAAASATANERQQVEDQKTKTNDIIEAVKLGTGD